MNFNLALAIFFTLVTVKKWHAYPCPCIDAWYRDAETRGPGLGGLTVLLLVGRPLKNERPLSFAKTQDYHHDTMRSEILFIICNLCTIYIVRRIIDSQDRSRIDN